jgi:formate-dependent nitrite reductase membrane component NrfD
MFIFNTLPEFNAALPVFFLTHASSSALISYLLQGLLDMNKPPEMISGNMTAGK